MPDNSNDLNNTLSISSGTQRGGSPNMGFTPPDYLLSNLIGPGTQFQFSGINRTNLPPYSINPNIQSANFPPKQTSPAIQLSETRYHSGETILQKSGFTPLQYYTGIGGAIYIQPNINNIMTSSEKNTDNINTIGTIYGDQSTIDFKYGFDPSVSMGDGQDMSLPSGKNKFESYDGSTTDGSPANPYRLISFSETPNENEDPVYFGFQIIIDSITSPLINGEVENFIKKIGGSYTEVSSRLQIIESFKLELSKFFKFTADINIPDDGNMFATSKNKIHYIKKIGGLEKLIEGNNSKSQSAFVKYKDDLIKLSFYEDVTLSAGTLASLYKLLYWSRLHGKNIIPENLLRFDCYITVSELRNIGHIRKVDGTSNSLEILAQNLSRYIYRVYECQFYFPQMTHPNEINIWEAPTVTDNWDIELSFKFSDMTFERFVPGGEYGSYVSLYNAYTDPQEPTPSDAETFNVDTNGNLTVANIAENPNQISGISNLTGDNNSDSASLYANGTTTSDGNVALGTVKSNNALINYQQSITQQNTVNQQQNDSDVLNQNNSLSGILSSAGDTLLQNIKTAALTEAQVSLNYQTILLNNTLSKIQNSFGFGAIPPPNNVYLPSGSSNFFFDVRNSIQGFAGDVLTGIITGK